MLCALCSDTSQISEAGLTETGHVPSGSNVFQDVLQNISKQIAAAKPWCKKLILPPRYCFVLYSVFFYLKL